MLHKVAQTIFTSICGNYKLNNASSQLPSPCSIFTTMDVSFKAIKQNITDLRPNEEFLTNDQGMITLTIGMEVFVDSSLYEFPQDSSFTVFGFVEPASKTDSSPIAIINNNSDLTFSAIPTEKLLMMKDPKDLQEVVQERFSGFCEWLKHMYDSKISILEYALPLKKRAEIQSMPLVLRKSLRKASQKARDTITQQSLSPFQSPKKERNLFFTNHLAT